MSNENDATIRFINPVPEAAREYLLQMLRECGFSAVDWDGATIKSLRSLGSGKATLYARLVPYDYMASFVALAKEHAFSLLLHVDWLNDGEGDFAGQIVAYDALDGREIDTPAAANSMEPVILMADFLSKTREELIRAHAIPKGLED